MNEKIKIEEIIKLVKEFEPVRQDINLALQNCKEGNWSSKVYYKFVDSINANQIGSEWQHEECIVIESKKEGDIVIDLLKDGKIGGIEFINLIED